MKNNIQKIPNGQYQWQQTWANAIAHTDINLVVAELEDIRFARGEITPQMVVESSRNKKSILHGYFQWDDTKAANSWRIQQANTLLRHIEVNVISDGMPKVVRVYATVSRPFDKTPVVFKRFDLLNSNDNALIKKMLISDLTGIRTRMNRLDFKEAIIHIDKAIEELSKESTETKQEEIAELIAV